MFLNIIQTRLGAAAHLLYYFLSKILVFLSHLLFKILNFWITIIFLLSAHTTPEVIIMASYVSPAIRDKFETLSIDLKNTILERNVQLNNIHDLINVFGADC